MRVRRQVILLALIAFATCSATVWSATIMRGDTVEANHAAAPDEFTITHSGGNPGPGGGGTTLNVAIGGIFTVETRASTITTSAPGYGYALSWTDAVVDPVAHIVDNHCTTNPLACTCVGPTTFTLGASEGVTGSCTRNSDGGTPPGPPPPIAAGETLVTSTLTCAAPGTTLVAMLGSDSMPASYTTLLNALGLPIATALENQVVNPAAPPATLAAVSVVCYEPVDASIVKTAPAAATEGDTITYAIDVANTHPTIPLDIDLSDTAPAGVTFVAYTESDPGACSMTPSSLTCTGFGVAPATGGVVTIDARMDGCGTITNTAAITSVTSPSTTVLDVVPANDTSSASTAVGCVVDASITKNGPASIATGGSGTYVLTAINPDTTPPIDVTITDTAPAGVTFTSVDHPACTITGGTALSCSLTIAEEGFATINLEATFTGCVAVVNTAVLAVVNVPDPNPANNAAAFQTSVNCIVDGSITKSAPTPLLTGASDTYVISATNPDPSLPIDVTIADTAPAGVTFTAVDDPGCTITGGTVMNCTLTIAPASTRVIHLQAMFTGCVTVVNAVSMIVTPPIIDPNPANNGASATSDVQCLVDASLLKLGPPFVHPPGTDDTYEFIAINPDPAFTLNAQIIDTAPPGVMFIAVDHPGCTITSGITLQCTIVILPLSSVAINLTASFDTCGLATNTATLVVGAPILDPNPLNNVSAVVTSICGSPDVDMDGCTEFEELGMDRRLGGQRNPLDPHDFFDVPNPATGPIQPDGKAVLSGGAVRDKAITLLDTAVIIVYVGRTAANPAYAADNNGDLLPDGQQLDRTPSAFPGQLWRAGPPNGAISLQDAAVSIASVGDTCHMIPN